MVLQQLRSAFLVLLLLTVLTGVLYPLAVTGIAQLIFPGKANGSLLTRNGKVVGSGLIGQQFNAPGYFWGRLSATSPAAYNASSSSASNFGPLNPALLDSVRKRVQALREADPGNTQTVPADLVTSSGSGLDPDISVAAALYQLPRVARIRGMRQEDVRALIEQCTEGRFAGILGEPRINVLKLNLALNAHQQQEGGL